jgi:Flp pilus assembly protein TadD
MRLLWSLVVLLCSSTTCITSRRHPTITKRALKEVRRNVAALSTHGRDQDLLLYLRSVETSYGTLLLDDELPSILLYKAVALYNAQNMSEAEDTLKLATEHYPSDSRAWINLGTALHASVAICRLHSFQRSLYQLHCWIG